MSHSTKGWAAVAVLGLVLLPSGCFRPKNRLPPFNPQPGSLEFCIVANDVDDDDVFQAVRDESKAWAMEPTMRAALKRLAEEGRPPPAPEETEQLRFTFKARDATYRWVELEPRMVKELRLDNTNEDNPLGREVAEARDEGTVAIVQISLRAAKIAIWSRNCVNQSLSLPERQRKQVDHFILIRNAFPGEELTEAHLEELAPGTDSDSFPIIEGKFNKAGGDRLRRLTTDNQPTSKYVCLLAIIIQGKLFSMPTLEAAMGEGKFKISGLFTEAYVKEVASRIRTAGQ